MVELIEQVNQLVRLLFRVIIVAGVAYLLLLWRARPDVVRARIFLYSDQIRTFFLALAVASAILAAEAMLLLLVALPPAAELATHATALGVLIYGVLVVVLRIPIRRTKSRLP